MGIPEPKKLTFLWRETTTYAFADGVTVVQIHSVFRRPDGRLVVAREGRPNIAVEDQTIIWGHGAVH